MSSGPHHDDRDLLTDEERAQLEAQAEARESPERKIRRSRRRNLARTGKRQERAVVKLLEGIPGIRARRVPGSGSIEGTEDCDVLVDVLGGANVVETLEVEVKARQTSAWKTLAKWKADADVLVLIEMQQEVGVEKPQPMVFMDWGLFQRLLEAYPPEA